MMTTNKLSANHNLLVDAKFHGGSVILPSSGDHHDGYYKFDGARRWLLIFNHFCFDDMPDDERTGTQSDEDDLKTTFANFGFDTVVYPNLTFSEIFSTLTEWRTRDLSDVDCLIIAVLTHGGKGDTLLAKDDPYLTSTLWNEIKRNETLDNKPKIFLIQACRGGAVDDGIFVSTDATTAITKQQGIELKLDLFLTLGEDMLLVHATVPGFVAHRYKSGSFFISELCEQLKHADFEQTDFEEVIRTANRKVAYFHESYEPQNPEFSDKKQTITMQKTLNRAIRFPVRSKNTKVDHV